MPNCAVWSGRNIFNQGALFIRQVKTLSNNLSHDGNCYFSNPLLCIRNRNYPKSVLPEWRISNRCDHMELNPFVSDTLTVKTLLRDENLVKTEDAPRTSFKGIIDCWNRVVHCSVKLFTYSSNAMDHLTWENEIIFVSITISNRFIWVRESGTRHRYFRLQNTETKSFHSQNADLDQLWGLTIHWKIHFS